MTPEEIIQLTGCVVKFTSLEMAKEQSGCGILFDSQEGIILAHGSLLTALCLANKSLASKISKGEFINGQLLPNIEFKVLIDNRWKTSSQAKIAWKINSDVLPPFYNHSFPSMYPCKCIAAFRNSDFHSVIGKVMPSESWAFEPSTNGETFPESTTSLQSSHVDNKLFSENMTTYHLLSYFVVFKMAAVTLIGKNTMSDLFILQEMTDLKLDEHICRIGDSAEIIATPFGSQNPSVFFNTYSRGIVSNVHGALDCWIITDARSIPGSEGAPLFTTKNHKKCLTGMVVASFCWKNKEWVGFSLASSLSSILYYLSVNLNTTNLNLYNFAHVIKSHQHPLDLMQKQKSHIIPNLGKINSILASTVLIRVGGTWGSGVIVNKSLGIILTCSHVIKDAHLYPVMVRNIQGSSEYEAQVVYSHNDHPHGPFDIGILICAEATSKILLDKDQLIRPPKLGEKVFVVGFALFSFDQDLLPSMSTGVISKLLDANGKMIMVQSTCAVHAGASGGPLLSADGHLLGVVVCNTVDKGSDSSYPHVNMSIPASSLLPALKEYIKTKNTSLFSSYYLEDLEARKLWLLDKTLIGGSTNYCPKSKL